MAGLRSRRADTATDTQQQSPYPAPVNPPATSYANVRSPLFTVTAKNSEYSDARNAPIVNRKPRKDGIVNDYVYGGSPQEVRALPTPPKSSAFQQTLVRLWPWSINLKWYIAYPAATVMNGGARNLGLSERTPQIQTRTSGGPGAFLMGARPSFTRVQSVPRYSTAPATYDTKATKA